MEIFKKVAVGNKPPEFEGFLHLLERLALEVQKERIDSVKKRLKEIRKLERGTESGVAQAGAQPQPSETKPENEPTIQEEKTPNEGPAVEETAAG